MLNIIKIYRIGDWLHYIGFIMLGFFLNTSFSIDILKYVFLGSTLLAYAFSLNDFFDKHEEKKFFLLPLILSLLILPLFNSLQMTFSFLFLFIVTFYSMPPLRFKTKPFISSFCNGIGFMLLFFIGYSVQNFTFKGILFGLLFFSFNMVAQFIHEVVDLEEDKKEKIFTTTLFFGEETIKKYCYIFLWFSFIVTIYLFYLEIVSPFFPLITFFFVTFFTIEILRKGIYRELRKKYKIFGIIVGLIYFSIILKP